MRIIPNCVCSNEIAYHSSEQSLRSDTDLVVMDCPRQHVIHQTCLETFRTSFTLEGQTDDRCPRCEAEALGQLPGPAPVSTHTQPLQPVLQPRTVPPRGITLRPETELRVMLRRLSTLEFLSTRRGESEQNRIDREDLERRIRILREELEASNRLPIIVIPDALFSEIQPELQGSMGLTLRGMHQFFDEVDQILDVRLQVEIIAHEVDQPDMDQQTSQPAGEPSSDLFFDFDDEDLSPT